MGYFSISTISFFLFLTLSGCTSTDIAADLSPECGYNKGKIRGTNQNFDPENAPRPSPSPIVKILDLTDEGEVSDRCQLSDALFEIKGNTKLSPLKERPKFIVLYVHGWKHNSNESDNDLKEFSALIEYLTDNPNNKSDVVGLYVSWPGKSINIPIIDNLSFWGRKGAADRVSMGGNLSKLLSTIANVRKIRANPEDVVVAIGHSFGARILYSSVSPLLLNELQMNHPGERLGAYGYLQGAVDLTILLNPAFEASRFTVFDTSRRWQELYHPKQQPILLSISTTNDYATKFAFPIGQLIGLRSHVRERTTLGNYGAYHTHRLGFSKKPMLATNNSRWYDHYCKKSLCLTQLGNSSQPGNPFIVATTDSSVLDGHNGIWSNSFQKWLISFIENTVSRRSQPLTSKL